MIPPVAHFVWFGRAVPWLNVLAIISAAKGGCFERVVLHLDGPREAVLRYSELARLPRVEVRAIDIGALARAVEIDPHRIQALLGSMSSPAARSNVIRALVLLAEGGVYLDVDTVTVRSFLPVLGETHAFVGQERICFPGWHAKRPAPTQRARSYALALLRGLLGTVPNGFRLFSQLEPLYSLWANNAVMGCEPRHPFMRAYVFAMLELQPELARRRYGVGPDLLQRVLSSYSDDQHPVTCLGPEVFYPLPPVISNHWWKIVRRPDLDKALTPSTLVVHWYASVRSRKRASLVNPAYIVRHRHHQLFAKLAARFIDIV